MKNNNNPFLETSHLRRILGNKIFCIFKKVFDFCGVPDADKFLNQNFEWATIDFWGGASWYAENATPPSVLPVATGLGSIVLGDGAEGLGENMFVVGYESGLGANANESIFIGSGSGGLATSAEFSIFIGHSAGNRAANAYQSFFLGSNSGVLADNAYNSIIIGNGSGNNATNANNVIFIGNGSGLGDIVNNSLGGTSILIGDSTSTGGFSDSVAIGATATNTATNQFMIGSLSKPLNIKTNGVVNLTGYTVATLPAGSLGDTCYVTDGFSPSIGSPVVGGGIDKVMVWYNGFQWRVTGF